MPTKVVVKEVRLYECEVKRRRLRSSGTGYEAFWKVKSVSDALLDGDTEFRCKDCHGEVKLHKRQAASGTQSHVQHKLRADSETCVAGMYFREATDGRTPRVSAQPVE